MEHDDRVKHRQVGGACGHGVDRDSTSSNVFPYAYPKAQIAERLEQYGSKQVLHNLRAGD